MANEKVLVSSGSTIISAADVMTGVTLVKNVKNLGDTMNVLAGGVASDTTVSSGGAIGVKNGGQISGATVKAYGSITVNAGGYAENLNYTDAAGNYSYTLTVNGGTVNNVNFTGQNKASLNGTVYNYNHIGYGYTDMNGGTVSGGSFNATQFDQKGGTVTEMRILGGKFRVRGNNERVTFNSGSITGGTLQVSNGVVNDLVISGGTVEASSTAVLNNTVMSNGTLTASSGAVVQDITMSAGVTTVSGGAVLSGVTVSGGNLYLLENATASGVTIMAGNATVSSGAVVTDFTAGGTAIVSLTSGSVISGTLVIKNAGRGFAATNLTVANDAQIRYDFRGTTLKNNVAMITGQAQKVKRENGTTYETDGYYEVRVDDTIGAGTQRLQTNGIGSYVKLLTDTGSSTLNAVNNSISNTSINQTEYFAKRISVSSNTYTLLCHRTYFYYLLVENPYTLWGNVNAAESWAGWFDAPLTGNSVGTAETITVGRGLTYTSMTVSSGATVAGAVVSSGGALMLGSGGTVTNAVISSGATNLRMDGGSIGTLTMMDSTGANVYAGAIDKAAMTGVAVVMNFSGSTLGSAAVDGDGAELRIYKNAVLSGATVESGGKINAYGRVENVDLNVSGYLYVMSGGYASGVEVTSGGFVGVSSTGRLDAVNVGSGAQLNVLAGGSASGVVVDGYANLVVTGQVENVTVGDLNKGNYLNTLTVQKGGVASNVTFTGVNKAKIYGALIDYNHISASYTDFYKGATLTRGLLKGGQFDQMGGTVTSMRIEEGTFKVRGKDERVTFANGTIAGGSMIVNNGDVNDLVISGGAVNVSSGAVMSGVTVEAGEATLNISSGATMSDLTVNAGTVTLKTDKEEASVNNVTVKGGSLTVQAYTNLTGSLIVSGGETSLAADTHINTLDVQGGTVTFGGFVYASGAFSLAENATLTVGGYCSLYYSGSIESGCTIKDFTLNANSVLNTQKYNFENLTTVAYKADPYATNLNLTSATLSGVNTLGGVTVLNGDTCTIASGAVVNVQNRLSLQKAAMNASGATIAFDLVNYCTKDGENMLNRMARITGAAYQVLVDNTVAQGSYYLAGYASDFTGSITVKSGDASLGTVTVGGHLASGDYFYGLSLQNEKDLYFSVASAIVQNVSVNEKTLSWDAIEGASNYWVSYSEDNGATWNTDKTVTGTSYTYTGSASNVQFKVQVSDGTNAGNASVLLSASADLKTAVAHANAGDKIQLAAGTYEPASAITVGAANVALIGQGVDPISGTILTTVAKAIYGAGNAVTIKDLRATSNLAGGAVNAATSTDLTVSSAQLKDAFAGSLVNNGTVEVASAGADLTGTQFRNLYGAGYATGSGAVLNNTTVELNVSGGCSRLEAGYGSIYGAGRVAGGATLNAGTVNVTVDNGSEVKLGALYAGGYSNNGAVNATTTNVTINSGDFAKFVAAGAQVYGASASSTIGDTDLTISGGIFENAVLGASYAAGGASASVTTATTEISGGSFHGYVAGGGYVNASTLTVGSVDLTITGGTFTKYIFGGNLGGSSAAAGTVTNAVNLTLDATSKAIHAQAIYAGSMNSGAVGSTVVDLKGEGSNLSFSKLYGCGSYSGTQTGGVTGTKALKFTGFSGDLSGRLYDFDTFTMTGSTVSFTQVQTLANISCWDLSLTSDVTDENALINWEAGGTNSFASDTMKLTFDTDSTTDLLVVLGDTKTKTVEEQEVFDLDLSTGGLTSVTLNGADAKKQGDGSWMATVEGVDWYLKNVTVIDEENGSTNNLVLSKSALA